MKNAKDNKYVSFFGVDSNCVNLKTLKIVKQNDSLSLSRGINSAKRAMLSKVVYVVQEKISYFIKKQ